MQLIGYSSCGRYADDLNPGQMQMVEIFTNQHSVYNYAYSLALAKVGRAANGAPHHYTVSYPDNFLSYKRKKKTTQTIN